MCLAVPMKIIERDNDEGVVEAGGVNYRTSFTLLPDAVVGDYVLVHAGFAIQKLDTNDALDTLKIFKEMEERQGGTSVS